MPYVYFQHAWAEWYSESLLKAELQIIGFKDNFSIFSFKTLCCDPSLEPSWQDDSNDGLQHEF